MRSWSWSPIALMLTIVPGSIWPATPAANVAPASTSMQPAAQSSTPPPNSERLKENPCPKSFPFNYKDAEFETIFAFVSAKTGFIIVHDGPIGGRVSIESAEPVTPEEAIELLKAVLRTYGYNLVRTGRVLEIKPVNRAKEMSGTKIEWCGYSNAEDSAGGINNATGVSDSRGTALEAWHLRDEDLGQ